MNLNHLRYLIAVADAGSFVKGAQRAFVTQPTLSQAVSNLEKELGHRVFVRTGQGVVLTKEGHRILGHARRILKETEVLRAGNRPNHRRFRIGYLSTLPATLISDFISNLPHEVTSSGFRLEEAPKAELRKRLRDGRFDAILTSDSGLGSGVSNVDLGTDRLALAYSLGNVPAGK